MRRVLIIVLVGFLSWQAYQQHQARNSRIVEAQESPKIPVAASASSSRVPQFNCDGRVYCSQMTSCEEATYFLRHCPGVKMDGNNDGVPCEQQWCRR